MVGHSRDVSADLDHTYPGWGQTPRLCSAWVPELFLQTSAISFKGQVEISQWLSFIWIRGKTEIKLQYFFLLFFRHKCLCIAVKHTCNKPNTYRTPWTCNAHAGHVPRWVLCVPGVCCKNWVYCFHSLGLWSMFKSVISRGKQAFFSSLCHTSDLFKQHGNFCNFQTRGRWLDPKSEWIWHTSEIKQKCKNPLPFYFSPQKRKQITLDRLKL